MARNQALVQKMYDFLNDVLNGNIVALDKNGVSLSQEEYSDATSMSDALYWTLYPDEPNSTLLNYLPDRVKELWTE